MMNWNAKLSILCMWALVFVGVFLRGFRADKFPINNNDDSIFYVWTGNTLLNNPFQTASHTIFMTNNPSLIWWSQYMDYDPINRFAMKIIRPWFDHPPFAGIFIAAPARFLGYTDLQQLPHMLVRYPAILASIVTMVFCFLLCRAWFGKSAAYWALAFLATTPYFVYAQRQSYLENFIIPTFLASLYFLEKWFESKHKKFFVVSLVLAAITGWMKIPAFAFPFMVAGWLWYKKYPKQGLIAGAVGVLAIVAYVSYGLIADAPAFLRTLSYQGVRGAFPGSFLDNVVNPQFYQPFLDGWYVFSIIAALGLAMSSPKENEKHKAFAWFFSAWLIALFLVSGRFNNSPWYKYPLIPFFAMSLGVYAKKLVEEKVLWIAAPFFVFGITGLELLQIDPSSTIVRGATVLIAVLFAAPLFFSRVRLFHTVSKIVAIVLLLGILLLNSVVTIRYPFLYCAKEQCQKSERFIVPNKDELK